MESNYNITTDKSKIDITVVHNYLSNDSYWAKNIPFDFVQKSIENSICFTVLHNQNQVGFARVITDKTTFAWIADVFILPQHRGIGLSKWLIQTILNHEELQTLRAWMLGTLDAHGLYEKFGFALTKDTTRIMRKQGIEGYT
jgi:GNAT superfamily N-acetyltransferase